MTTLIRQRKSSYNHSNLVRVTKTGGAQINQTPLTRQWCWIKL